MNKVMEFLSGKKTYIAAVLTILLGIVQQDNQMIMEGLMVIFLRQGVKKLEVKK